MKLYVRKQIENIEIQNNDDFLLSNIDQLVYIKVNLKTAIKYLQIY